MISAMCNVSLPSGQQYTLLTPTSFVAHKEHCPPLENVDISGDCDTKEVRKITLTYVALRKTYNLLVSY